MNNNDNHFTRYVIVTIIVFIVIFVAHDYGYWYTKDDILGMRDTAYDEGYDEGYKEGYDKGQLDYEDSLYYNDSTYYNPNEAAANEPQSSPEVPSTAVFVTATGEKYHQGGCRYIEGKNNLSYFDTAEDAMRAGYTACSVCY